MSATILLVPGLYGSGVGHWQTRWEAALPQAQRVQQRDWNEPRRSEWVAQLDAAVRASAGPVVLAAHSLGCATTVWWALAHAATPHARRVSGALLVAPPDVERADAPAAVRDFGPMPGVPLPFASIVVASENDPWCALPRAHQWAQQWGAQWQMAGRRGHLNADSGLGDWPQGQRWLQQLSKPAASNIPR
ncbi:MAG TPA: alpha/beta hydrolase [Burkholderiaceae bacterium]|nr:alpha/beta hydrolase [Burkholderiaceae bacterium]